MNVVKLYKDKKVLGICIAPAVFMAVWGLYGLFFYSFLDTPWSFYCCIPIAIVNCVFVSQMIYYRKN